MSSPYEIFEKLGEGGMGEVFRARHRLLERDVAIKFLKQDAAAIRENLARFRRETKVSVRLSHPGIISVYDAGELDGRPYIAMELLVGARPLNKVIADEGPFSVARTCGIMDQILSGLAHCHELGFIHRDIKPANVMLQAGDRAILMDFGIAKREGGTMLTERGAALGTPAYMAPEIFEGEEGTQSADLWAMGLIFYEMLTRRKAFPGKDVSHLIHLIANEDPVDITELRNDLPGETQSLIMEFLAKSPSERVPSARVALDRISSWYKRQLPPPEPEPDTSPSPPPSPEPARRSLTTWLSIGAILISVTLLAVWTGSSPSSATLRKQETSIEVEDVRLKPGGSLVEIELSAGAEADILIVVTRGELEVKRVTMRTSGGGVPSRAVITGLEPETNYEVALLDSSGQSIGRAYLETLSLPKALGKLEKSLREFDPYPQLLDLVASAEQVWTRNRPVDPKLVAEFRDRWQHRLRGLRARTRVDQVARDFEGIENRFTPDPALFARVLSLQESIADFQELDRRRESLGIELPGLTTAFTSAAFAPVVSCTHQGFRHVTYRFHPASFHENDATRPPSEKGGLEIDTGFIHGFETLRDPRDRSASANLLGIANSSRYIHPEPLVNIPAGSTDWLILEVDIHNLPVGSGFKVFVNDRPSQNLEGWKLIGVFLSQDNADHVKRVCRRIPTTVVQGGPKYIQVQLIPERCWYLEAGPTAPRGGYLDALTFRAPR